MSNADFLPCDFTQIKTLTFSLIRTQTVFRPRPHLTAGTGFDSNDPVNAEIDFDACQTQTTKKKVAEETLDMGKKAAKGDVTAKGTWMGVDKGEQAEFCHYLQVPVSPIFGQRVYRDFADGDLSCSRKRSQSSVGVIWK